MAPSIWPTSRILNSRHDTFEGPSGPQQTLWENPVASVSTSSSPALLVDRHEAARLLAISTRTLWAMTKAGEIDCVRIGKSVRYSPAAIQAWIARKTRGGAA